MNLQESIELVKDMVDIPITTHLWDNTHYQSYSGAITGKIIKEKININISQINKLVRKGILQLRGYNKKYVYLQSILHEIAHSKQAHKYGRKRIKKPLYNMSYRGLSKRALENDIEFYTKETIADRYARLHYKKFLKKTI